MRMCEEPGREGGGVGVDLAPDPSTQRVVQENPGSQDLEESHLLEREGFTPRGPHPWEAKP